MNIIIAGGRTFLPPKSLHETYFKLLDVIIEKLVPDENERIMTVIVSGTCPGADVFGELYAEHRNYKVIQKPAKWDDLTNCNTPKTNRAGKLYNPRAGFIRNIEMSKIGDSLIVLWDGQSNGSRHMKTIMEDAGKPVEVILYESFEKSTT